MIRWRRFFFPGARIYLHFSADLMCRVFIGSNWRGDNEMTKI